MSDDAIDCVPVECHVDIAISNRDHRTRAIYADNIPVIVENNFNGSSGDINVDNISVDNDNPDDDDDDDDDAANYDGESGARNNLVVGSSSAVIINGSTAGPQCWTLEESLAIRRDNPWLRFNGAQLKCSICAETDARVQKAVGFHLSKEWVEGCVKPRHGVNGKTAIATSLNNKIVRHGNSDTHKAAKKLLDNAVPGRSNYANANRQSVGLQLEMNAGNNYYHDVHRHGRHQLAVGNVILADLRNPLHANRSIKQEPVPPPLPPSTSDDARGELRLPPPAAHLSSNDVQDEPATINADADDDAGDMDAIIPVCQIKEEPDCLDVNVHCIAPMVNIVRTGGGGATVQNSTQSKLRSSNVINCQETEGRGGGGTSTSANCEHDAAKNDKKTSELIGKCAETRRRIVQVLKESRPRMSILVDEAIIGAAGISSTSTSTTVDQQDRVLVVCVRANFVGDRDNQTLFFDMIKVPASRPDGSVGSAAAERAIAGLLSNLKSHGIDMHLLQEILIGFSSDAASPSIGKRSGIGAVLRSYFRDVVVWHTGAHRLQQAVGDAVELSVPSGVDNFRSFVDELHGMHRSARTARQHFDGCSPSEDLDTIMSSIGSVFDSKWMASCERTVSAVWRTYPALHEHFQKCAADGRRDWKERSTCDSLVEKLSSEVFVQNMAIVYDALGELAELSANFRTKNQWDATVSALPRSQNLIARQIAFFEARKTRPGTHSQQATADVKTKGAFKGVELHPNRQHWQSLSIDRAKFYKHLADDMRSRLMVASRDDGTTVGTNGYGDLLSDVRALDPTSWPDYEDMLHGEVSVIRLAHRFRLDSRDCVQGFRDFKDNGGKPPFPDQLRSLVKALDCICVDTSDCARVLDALNTIATADRSGLAIGQLSCLLFDKVNREHENRINRPVRLSSYPAINRGQTHNTTTAASAAAATTTGSAQESSHKRPKREHCAASSEIDEFWGLM